MKLTDLFRRKPSPAIPYDHERMEPVLRCSICTGEQVAGFRDRQTSRFEEIQLVRTDADLQAFMDRYGIEKPLERIY